MKLWESSNNPKQETLSNTEVVNTEDIDRKCNRAEENIKSSTFEKQKIISGKNNLVTVNAYCYQIKTIKWCKQSVDGSRAYTYDDGL